MTMSKDQQQYVEELRSKFRAHADQAREFDRLADQVQELRHLYSQPAHREAVRILQEMRDAQIVQRDRTRDKLKETEGYQSVRP